MGSSSGTTGDTREAILRAATELFLSPDYSPFGSLTLDRIAEQANVSRSTLSQHFGDRRGLIEALARFMLREDHRHNEQAWDGIHEQLIEVLHQATDVEAALKAIVTERYLATVDDPSLRAQVALWPYAERDEKIRASLLEMFRVWDDGMARVLLEFFDENVGLIHRRQEWISISEMAMMTTIIPEGIAMRRALDGPNEIADDLAARAMLGLLSTMLVFVEGDDNSVIDVFARLSELRAKRTQGNDGA